MELLMTYWIVRPVSDMNKSLTLDHQFRHWDSSMHGFEFRFNSVEKAKNYVINLKRKKEIPNSSYVLEFFGDEDATETIYI